MEKPKKTTLHNEGEKAMEGRLITNDGVDHKDDKFHKEDLGIDEEATLERLRNFVKKEKG